MCRTPLQMRRLLDIFRRESAKAPGARSATASVSSSGLGRDPLIIGGDGMAMKVATVYSCVKLLEDAVACLPIEVRRLSGHIFVPHTRSVLPWLLNVSPNDLDNAYDLKAQTVGEILLEGNAYWFPRYESPHDAEPCEILLCNRGTCNPQQDGTYYIEDRLQDIHGIFMPDEVIHFKGMTSGYDRRRGVSVITHAAEVIGIAAEGDRETKERFASGGNIMGIVSNGKSTRGFGEYQDAELENAALDLDKLFHRENRKIVSVGGQIDFKQLSMSSADLQFLDSRKFTVIDICRFFRVPPSFVFADTSTNYKSVEMANTDFLTHTLNPLLCRMETELLRKLFGPTAGRRRKITFNRSELNACDMTSRVKYQMATIQAGLRSPNEWRCYDDLPPVEGGDTVLVSANLKPITDPAASPVPQGNQTTEDHDENDD